MLIRSVGSLMIAIILLLLSACTPIVSPLNFSTAPVPADSVTIGGKIDMLEIALSTASDVKYPEFRCKYLIDVAERYIAAGSGTEGYRILRDAESVSQNISHPWSHYERITLLYARGGFYRDALRLAPIPSQWQQIVAEAPVLDSFPIIIGLEDSIPEQSKDVFRSHFALYYMQQNRHDESDYFSRRIARPEQQGWFYINASNVYAIKGDTPLAVRFLGMAENAANRPMPSHWRTDILTRAAAGYIALGCVAQSTSIIVDLSTKEPDLMRYDWALRQAAISYSDIGLYETSFTLLNELRSTQRDPYIAQAIEHIAGSYIAHDSFNSAVTLIEDTKWPVHYADRGAVLRAVASMHLTNGHDLAAVAIANRISSYFHRTTAFVEIHRYYCDMNSPDSYLAVEIVLRSRPADPHTDPRTLALIQGEALADVVRNYAACGLWSHAQRLSAIIHSSNRNQGRMHAYLYMADSVPNAALAHYVLRRVTELHPQWRTTLYSRLALRFLELNDINAALATIRRIPSRSDRVPAITDLLLTGHLHGIRLSRKQVSNALSM